jgi:hypothetical protein
MRIPRTTTSPAPATADGKGAGTRTSAAGFFLVFFLGFFLFGPAAARAQRDFMIPVTVSPQTLVEDYHRNFPAADAKYTGKLLIITGRIKAIRPPPRNYDYRVDKIYPYITINTGPNLPLAVYFWGWEAEKFLKNLSTGNTVSVMGFCQGVPPQLSLYDACVYPSGCGGPIQNFDGPYFKLPPKPGR